MDHTLVAVAAEEDKRIADFLYWSHFPFATVQPVAGGTEVVIGDARYARSPQEGPFRVRSTIVAPR